MRHLVWDENKRQRNRRVHGYDFEDAYDFAWDSANISQTYPGSLGTPRLLATGWFEGRLVTIIFSVLGAEAFSIVSMRPASRKERIRYGSQ